MPSLLEKITSKFTAFLLRQTRNYNVLLVYGVLSGIFGVGRGGLGGGGQQYISLYIVALGATPTMFGFLQSLGNAARSVTSTPIGWVMDRYNLKKLLMIGLILQYAPFLVYIIAGNIGFHFWWAIPSRIIEALALALTWSSTNLLIAKSLIDEDRATGYSMRMTFSRIPGLITPILWAFIVATFGGINVSGIRPLFFMMIIGQTILILWIHLKLEVSDPKSSSNPVNVGESTTKRLSSFLYDLRETFRAGIGVKRWILISCFDMYCFSSIMGFTQLFAVEVKGANPFVLGLMETALTAISLLLTIPMGRLGDRIGRKKIIYLGLPPIYAWILLLLYAPSSIYLVVSWIFYGLLMATFPVWPTITMELVPEAYRGRFSGVSGFFTSLISIPASLVAGLMWTTFNPKLPFLVALSFESFAVILTKSIPETLKKR